MVHEILMSALIEYSYKHTGEKRLVLIFPSLFEKFLWLGIWILWTGCNAENRKHTIYNLKDNKVFNLLVYGNKQINFKIAHCNFKINWLITHWNNKII